MGSIMIEDGPGFVVLAAYRPNLELLRRQIETLSAQTVTNWTCEIGIDGDDAETRDRILELVGHDARFTVSMFEDRLGFYRNFERLLQRVPRAAAWVALADQDDDWYPEKFERLVPLLETASLAFGQAYVVNFGDDASQALLAERHIEGLAATMIDNQVTGSLAVFRRDLLDIALPFPRETDVAFHDHWLGICALVSDGIATTPTAVQNYVQHSANVIGEEKPSSLRTRMGDLDTTAGNSVVNRLDYISNHRWGWRVNVARSLLAQSRTLEAPDQAVLEMYARNRVSPALVKSTLGCVARRDVPVLRAFALLAGAARAPFVRRTP